MRRQAARNFALVDFSPNPVTVQVLPRLSLCGEKTWQEKNTNYENCKTPRPVRGPCGRSDLVHRLRFLQEVLCRQTVLLHEVLR